MCVRARACVLARARGNGVEVEERRGFTYSLLVQTSPINSLKKILVNNKKFTDQVQLK